MPDGVPRGLGIIVFDGGFERVHYALAIAAAALAIDRPVAMLFAGASVAALRPEGWRLLADPDGFAARQAEAGVADAETLYGAAVALGARIAACDMAMASRGLTLADLRPGIVTGGLVGFLADTAGGQVLFI